MYLDRIRLDLCGIFRYQSTYSSWDMGIQTQEETRFSKQDIVSEETYKQLVWITSKESQRDCDDSDTKSYYPNTLFGKPIPEKELVCVELPVCYNNAEFLVEQQI